MLDLDLTLLRYFHFLRPWWFLALLPMIVAIRYLWMAQDPVSQWRGLIAPHILKHILVRGSRLNWLNPVRLALIAGIIAVIAMAGPSWERRSSPFTEDEAALVIALDVSGSMDQEDVQPSRLDRSKQKIHDLLELRGGARTGLIVYAGTAHSVIPLTNDPDILRNFLDAIDTAMMPRPGKIPEKALPLADIMFRGTNVPGTLLMIGDGVGPDSKTAFAEYFKDYSHQLLVLGIGIEEINASLESRDEGFLPLERKALEELTTVTGGAYQELTLDKQDVNRLNRRINSYFLNVEDGMRPWVDAGYYLLFPMALLFLLWFRKGWTLHWAVVAGILFLSTATPSPVAAAEFRFMDLWMTSDQQGRFYLEKGDYEKAAARFEDLTWKAVAYYLNENFDIAVELFARIETADGFFNLGNAYAHGQNYLLARNAYTQVLRLNPQHEGAARNRKIVQDIIDDINRMSESQQAEMGEQSKELNENDPKRAEGAERKDMVPQEVEQLSAEQILKDQKLHDIWMRQVQPNPAQFLSVKFFMQLEQNEKLQEDEQ